MAVSDDSRSTSASLIRRAQRLDPDAWNRLCEIYGPLVYSWARQTGLREEDIADVGQEVFRTVAMRIAEFRKTAPQDTFRGWLRVITRNKIGDFIRVARNQPRPQPLDPAILDHPPATAEATNGQLDEAAIVIQAAMRSLQVEFTETTWQAFWRATVDEQPHDVIAADLGITRQAVRQAKYRVLRRLRDELADDDVI